ncbi:unnamed protein product [Phytophthora fragariaefolia]|uniref:Unnamed protein product n=1 Tax=Phytophthora fragariaefolia TaxID=1490495 RepID=A0A9W7D764_9STRA|nr:unnamed protein product [Phytophthora fragariaefolia]
MTSVEFVKVVPDIGHDSKKKGRKYSAAITAFVIAVILAISLVLIQQPETQQTNVHVQRNLATSPNQAGLYEPKPLFFFLGDSITEEGISPSKGGYIPLLQNMVSRSADVIAHGLSGYNTRWVLKYAMPVVEEEIQSQTYTPTVVTIWFGTNDAVIINGSRSEKHVPIDSYKENLVQIVRKFQALVPSADILLVTPPHVDDEARHNHAENGLVDRSHARSGMYARACVETANLLGIPVLDLFNYFSAKPVSIRNSLLWDGLHFSPQGHKIVSNLLLSKIKSVFPDVAKALRSWKMISSSVLCESDPWIPEITSDAGDSTA